MNYRCDSFIIKCGSLANTLNAILPCSARIFVDDTQTWPRRVSCPSPGVIDRGEGESGYAVGLQQLRKQGLHLALVVAAPLFQLHCYLLQLTLYLHLVLKPPLFQ